MGKAWHGRLPQGTDAQVERFTESISFDHRLFREDVAASSAHARMLAKIGLMTNAEAESIADELQKIAGEIEAGQFPYDTKLEDIHMHIESALVSRLGDVGRKLHTARSRNDQVVTDLRLWCRNRLDKLAGQIVSAQKSLLDLAIRSDGVVLPGYTHLQRAQPILAAHYLLAHVERLERDRERVLDARRRVNRLSLGSAALAGTTIPIDREFVAQQLGFDEVMRNSVDGSCARDFVLETGFVCAMLATHLSSWAEEWVLWSTTEFDFINLPDELCTGSSIMPQKKNPDVMELVRGKSARVIGQLQTLLVLCKGLPLAYNRDLQEDKPAIFDAVETVSACLDLAALMAQHAEFKQASIEARLEDGFLDATTLMETLIKLGVPMRLAHEQVGSLVRTCIEKKCRLADLPWSVFKEVSPNLKPEDEKQLRSVLGVKQALAAFRSQGSTAPSMVKDQLAFWKNRLAD